MTEERRRPEEKEPTGHVVHMWEPLHFEVKEDFDYRRMGPVSRLTTGLLFPIAAVLLEFINHIVLGMRIMNRDKVRELKNTGFVSVCNHVHYMDCTMLALAFCDHRPIHFVSLASNFRIPLVRHLIRILGAVPINSKPQDMKRLFEEMTLALEDGAVVQVYPEGILAPYWEGTRTFQKGAFYLAVQSGKPVLPSVITFHRPKGVYRLYKRKPCIHLTLLEPVYPTPGDTSREEILRLRDVCRNRMEEFIRCQEK